MELYAIKNLRTNRCYHDTILARDIWGFISCAKEMAYETARMLAEAFEAEGLILDIVRVH